MKEFLVVFVLSSLFVTTYKIMFGDEYSKSKERREVTYKITAKAGIIGCLTEEKFNEATKEYRANNIAAIQKMIADGACFSFQYGDELTALSETCDASNEDNDAAAFQSKKVWLREVYLPCFAVR
ncbi:MAG: hypothetical protein KGP29_03665 [Proteobacteria bacterium]|nr:hypothetical protein [Pseudomonadota bacterium]